MAAIPASLAPDSRVTFAAFMPPRANTGMQERRTMRRNRQTPKPKLSGWLLLRNTGAKMAALAPLVPARTSVRSECAAIVINQAGCRTRQRLASAARRSGKCTPSASTRAANSGSSAIRKITPRCLAARLNARAARARVAGSRWRKIITAPFGSAARAHKGSLTRTSSVIRTRAGSAAPRPPRLRPPAALASFARARSDAKS